MTFEAKVRKTAMVMASALAMTLGATAALAQTTDAPSGAPPGPHRHGHGDMITHAIASAKSQLNLNTSQQQMFDAAVASSKAAWQSGKTIRQSVKDTLATELAKSEPDLAAVAAAGDNARAQGQALHQQVRAQWLALYATFTPDQKAVVKNLIQQHMAQAETMHAQMLQRWQQGAGAAGAPTTN
jgi:Spy/CpxP family protein refolding chaperone